MAEPGRRNRAGFVGLDQALSSLTGFLLSALSLRLLPPDRFAVFTLFYSGYLLVVLLVRAVAGDVANAAVHDRTGQARRAEFVALTLGVLLAASVAVVGLAAGSATALAGAAVLPGLLLQDAIRMAAIATYRPRIAALADGCALAWFVLAGAVFLAVGRAVSLPMLLAAWGLGGYLAVAVCLLRHRDLAPLSVAPLRWLVANRTTAVPFAGEAFMQNGLNAAVSYTMAAVAGLGQLALFKAATLTMGPASLLLQAGGVFLVSEGVRERARRDVRRLVRVSTAVLCGLTACWVAAALLAPPGAVGRLFGDTAVRARPLLPYLGVCTALAAAVQARQAAIRVLQRPALAFRTRTVGAVCVSVAMVAGAWLHGGGGAARFGVAGYALALLISHRGVSTAVTAPAPVLVTAGEGVRG